MSEIQTAPAASATIAAVQPDVTTKPPTCDNVAIGYLRAFSTVLVLAHHAVLAYIPFAPPSPASLVTQPRWWEASPVMDTQRWSGFALIVGFKDVR
jgi:hypothetical protein